MSEDSALQRGDSFELTKASYSKRGVQYASDAQARERGVNPDNLQVVERLGAGAGASHVERAVCRATGRNYALKVVNVFDAAQRRQMMREIDSHGRHDCPCLVRYHGAFVRNGQVRIALEYMDGGSLDALLAARGPLPEEVLAAVAYQVLWGLAYLRHEREFHRDIKPQNILVNRDGEVKLTDFGISRCFGDSMSMAKTFVGTILYMSPERISNEPYNFKADIWSLGIVLMELATGERPFAAAGSNHLRIACAIADLSEPRLPADAGFSAELRDLIEACVVRDPAERLPPDVLLCSPWFTRSLGAQYTPSGHHVLEECQYIVSQWIDAPADAAGDGAGASGGHK